MVISTTPELKPCTERRSPHAIAVDNALKAKTRFPKGQQDYTAWAVRKNRSDIEGIDVGAIMVKVEPPPVPKGQVPPPITVEEAPSGAPKPTTKQELEEHPIVLRGDPKTVARFQPILDDKYWDLKKHPLNARVIDIEETNLDSAGAAGMYSMRSIDTRTGKEWVGSATSRDIDSGRLKLVPKKIMIDTVRQPTNADVKDSFTHETAHLRKHIQSDAKLRTSISDNDQEEREVVLESNARGGGALLRDKKLTNYYGYVTKRDPTKVFPQVALEDLRELGLYSEGGVTDTEKIEHDIGANVSKTELSKQLIAQPGPYLWQGRRFKGRTLGDPEKVDQVFTTSEGDFAHIYTPRQTAKSTVKNAARLVDAEDGVVGEERVYQLDDRGGRRLVRTRGRRRRVKSPG